MARTCCSVNTMPWFCASRASKAFKRRANVCRSLRTHTLRTPVGEAHHHNVGVEHHKRHPSVPFQRILQMKVHDGLLFPLFQPEIAGNPTIVLIDAAIAFPPRVEIACRPFEPNNEAPGADLRLLRPAPDENPRSDPARRAVRRPRSDFPNAFFSATCSTMSSARSSAFVWIFFSR